MRAAIVTAFLSLSIAVLGSSAFADDYAAATARCAKEHPGEFAAQMSCIQRERCEPSRSEATDLRPELRSVNKRFSGERSFTWRTLED